MEEAAAAAEAAVAALHSAMGAVRAYVIAGEQRHVPAADGSGELAPYRSHANVLDAFLRYTRFLVAAVDADTLRPAPMQTDTQLGTVKAPRPMTSEQCAVGEAAHLRGIVETLTQELSDELAEMDSVDAHRRRLTDQLEALRMDASLVRVYQARVRELLGLLGNESEATATRLTRIAEESEDQHMRGSGTAETPGRAAMVATELGRLTANMKDKLDRSKAEAAKLHADRSALLAENAVLFQRVTGLEERLAALSTQQSSTLKQLDRSRVRAAETSVRSQQQLNTSHASVRRSGTPGANSTRMTVNASPSGGGGGRRAQSASRAGGAAAGDVGGGSPPGGLSAPGPSSIRIGDVIIDRDVALWMKDMYATLAKDPETSSLVPSVHKQTFLHHPDGGDLSTVPGSTTSATTQSAKVSEVARATPHRGTGFSQHVSKIRTQDPS